MSWKDYVPLRWKMDRSRATSTIVAFLKERGFVEGEDYQVVEGEGVEFTCGSARMRVGIGLAPEGEIFWCVSEIVEIPSSHPAIVRLYRKLLELNAEAPWGVRIYVEKDRVNVGGYEPVSMLDEARLKQLTEHVAVFADEWDDRLINEYEARRIED